MEILNPRAALLSNFEVLSLLRELESDYLSKQKTAQRIKKEEAEASASGLLSLNTNANQGVGTSGGAKAYEVLEEIAPNLRTVEVEAIQYLSADYHPTTHQTEAGIAHLTKSLEPYGLNKSEKLQIVNLAPVETVELYVIVEEMEDRLGERMDEVLSHVRTSLSDTAVTATAPPTLTNGHGTETVLGGMVYQEDVGMGGWEQGMEGVGDEFVDAGEGMGVEGDLDVEED